MKTLIFLITIITATSLVRANESEEIIWETEQIGGINDVLVSPLGEIFYNVTGSTIQIRSVADGTLIDFFIPEDMPNHITDISITDDGRYMAMSGDNPHIVIYDLQETKEVKRFTTTVFEREQNGELVQFNTKKWLSSSISPDGTKVTGVAEGDRATSSTCWVVIDIASGEELVKEARLGYDVFNPQKYDISEWISSEFTPDGNYIVSQIDWIAEDKQSPDSIYIYNAKTFEIYDVVNNYYSESNLFFNLGSSQSEFTYYNPNVDKISIFNVNTKKSIETNIKPSIWSFTFLRSSKFIIYAYDSESQLYDYVNDNILHEYEKNGKGWSTTMDDKLLISSYNHKILGINTLISKTNIENDFEEKIVISPNPTNSSVNIKLECVEPIINYSIYDLDSTLISQNIVENQSGNITLDFSTYPSGIYFLSFQCNNEMKVYKIIKEG